MSRKKDIGKKGKKTFEREILGFPLSWSTILAVFTSLVSLALLLGHGCKVFAEIYIIERLCVFCVMGGLKVKSTVQ